MMHCFSASIKLSSSYKGFNTILSSINSNKDNDPYFTKQCLLGQIKLIFRLSSLPPSPLHPCILFSLKKKNCVEKIFQDTKNSNILRLVCQDISML